MQNQVLVSVVTVSYNAVSTIEQTILSVINQTYLYIEYIIIDGGSTDGTVDIIKKYADKIAYWVSEPDKGIYDAMNKGIKVATGEWINFMNCGDRFYDKNVLAEIFLKNNEADVIYGNVMIDVLNYEYIHLSDKLDSIKLYMPFCHQSSFVKTYLVQRNPFDLKYKFVADYNMFYQFYRQGYVFKYVNMVVACYNKEGGFTDSNSFNCIREAFKVNEENVSSIFIGYLKIKSIIKSLLPKSIQYHIRFLKYMIDDRYIKKTDL